MRLTLLAGQVHARCPARCRGETCSFILSSYFHANGKADLMASSTTSEGLKQRLGHRPTLTTWDAIAQSLSIGPIFSSAFVAFLIAGSAGGAAPLSTLLGAVGVLALGWLIAFYARRGGGAGAIYDYLRRVSPAIGLFAA